MALNRIMNMDKMQHRQDTDLDVPGRPNSRQSDEDMNQARRNTRMGTGIRNEDDIDLDIESEWDDDLGWNEKNP